MPAVLVGYNQLCAFRVIGSNKFWRYLLKCRKRIYRICINVSRYCDQKDTLFFICLQARNSCALHPAVIARPHKAELNSCSSFAMGNVCGIASVESNFTHVFLYTKKLPIISTASMKTCGYEILLEIACNYSFKIFFQKGKKRVEKEKGSAGEGEIQLNKS